MKGADINFKSADSTMSKYRTRLVYCIDEGLCVIPKETTDFVTLTLARKDRLDQRREFVQSERPSDQTSTDWGVEIEESAPYTRPAKAGSKTYHSRILRLLWDR